jgi:hypothetical protein
MKQVLTIFFLLALTQPLLAQREIGPEGHKLLWFVLSVVGAIVVLFVMIKALNPEQMIKKPFVRRRKVSIDLVKDRPYYPDELEFFIKNTGNTAVDLNLPVLVFSSVWLKRKFRLKGTNNASFYPLYLDKGQSHSLNIDLNRFYSHDKSLKKLPKAKIIVSEVKGRKLGSQSVFLRKTLFKF